MSTALKQNSDFQATSLEWLGRFPSRWSVEPGLAVLQERQVKNIGLVEPTVLSLSYGRVVIKPQDKLRGLVPESFETYQIVEPGNIIIRPTDLQNDHVSLRVGQAKDRGIITSAYMCLETKGKLTEDYAHLLLHAYDIKKVFYGLGSGLRQNLSWVDFRRLPIPVPPPDEQAQIVRFICPLDQRVNRLIKTKRRLIELLNEQKQAIIHRAVTRGLDPTVPLKPSGIFWLPEIPAHWKPVRVKSVLLNLNNRRIPLSSTERGHMTTREFDYYGASSVIDKVDDFIFDDELLLIAEDGANLVLRNLPLAIIARGKFWVNNHAHILKPIRGSLEYWAMLLECVNYRPWISGAAQPKLTKDRLMAVPIPCPTDEEQNAIVEYVMNETAGIRLAIDKTKSEIDLIREYRTRLVADVVTGQLDVRHLDLPEVEESLIEAIDAGSDPELDEDTEEAVDAD